MLRRRPFFAAPLGVLLLVCAGARAEEQPVFTTTWSQEALESVEESAESPELRTLRMAEEELFGAGPEEGPERMEPDCVYGPEHPQENLPPEKLERASGSVDLAFLKELKLPALPVRWDPRVIEYLLFFKDDPRGRELAAAWLKRRERYGPMVRRVLAEHSLPADLQYVAMIESGYDPLAHSAAEAWGMWQFIEQPAEYYGLRVDHWADERLDPERSTRAAARFLRDLYERFESWELAFAAYNMGYGGLLRAIKKYNSNDYWLLSHLEAGLPFETSLYVAKITAMAIVASNPERFGFDKLGHDEPVQLAKVDVAVGTPLKQIASAAGLTLDELRSVNPHLKQARVPPGEPSVNVYVPKSAQVRFAQHWPLGSSEDTPLPYVLRVGETLEEVARRSAVSVQRLRELNALGSEVSVAPGFALLLPREARPTAHLVEPLVATVPARKFEYSERRHVFYRVTPDDSVSSVAKYFAVTPEELARWNNLAQGAALHAGMLLQLFVSPALDLSQAVVFAPDEVRILTVGSDEFFEYHEAQRGRVRVRYRVQPGDTVGALAQRFDLSAGSIGRINQFASDRELVSGEWIVLYAKTSELPALEERGLASRIGSASLQALASKAEEQRPEHAAKRDPALPEAEGHTPPEPAKERPLAPPPKRPASTLKQPSRALQKAPKQAAKKS